MKLVLELDKDEIEFLHELLRLERLRLQQTTGQLKVWPVEGESMWQKIDNTLPRPFRI